MLVSARERGLIPWEWIVDETRPIEQRPQWGDVRAYSNTVMRSYRRDFWETSDTKIVVVSEKSTVGGVLRPVIDEYGVSFLSVHGSGIEREQISIPGGNCDSNSLPNAPDPLEPEIMCRNDIEARLRETFFTLDKEARLELIGFIHSLLENLQREAEDSCDGQGFDWSSGEQR